MNSSTPIKSSKADEALNLLLSNHPSKADLYSLLMELGTDELLRVLSYAGIVTKTPIQVRHELLRDARTQLSNRLIFTEARIGDYQGDELCIDTYIKELQSINKRFKVLRKSDSPIGKIRRQVASLQGELIRLQAMPTRFEISNVSFSDVAKYASAISKQLSDWQLKCQETALADQGAPGKHSTTKTRGLNNELSSNSNR